MRLTPRNTILFVFISLSSLLNAGCQIGNFLNLQDAQKTWKELNAYSYSFEYQYGCATEENCADLQSFPKFFIKVDEDNNKTIQTKTGAFVDDDLLPEEWHVLKMDQLFSILFSAIIDNTAGEITFSEYGSIIQGSDFYISNFDFIEQPNAQQVAKLNKLKIAQSLWENTGLEAYTYDVEANCNYFECEGFDNPYLKARVVKKVVTNIRVLDDITPSSFLKNVTTIDRIYALLKDEILRGGDAEYSYDLQTGHIIDTQHYKISNLKEFRPWNTLKANMDKMLSEMPTSYILKYTLDCFCEPIHNFYSVRVENNRIVERIHNDVVLDSDTAGGLRLEQLFYNAQLFTKRSYIFQIVYDERGMPRFMHVDDFEYFEDDERTYRNITLEEI